MFVCNSDHFVFKEEKLAVGAKQRDGHALTLEAGRRRALGMTQPCAWWLMEEGTGERKEWRLPLVRTYCAAQGTLLNGL